MDNKYLQYLTDSFTGKDNLKKVRDEASKIEKTYELEEFRRAYVFGQIEIILRKTR